MIEADKKVITHINWLAVDFDIVEQSVKILQNRIVKAKLASRSRMVKKLQSLLVKSLNARILAVKRVSENKGKNTAGVDGKLLDTNIKKSKYVADLKIKLPDYKSMPLKRIEIPKKNGKLRPLGIPTMFDRSIQALYKLALEPIAEVVADKNSYGFRPKRSTQDAMKQVWLCTSKKNGGGWTLILTNSTINNSTPLNYISYLLFNLSSPSITNSYSILSFADKIKKSPSGFQYMIEAGKRGELGGIWTVNSNYSFISITNNNTDITLIKKFGNWSYSDRGIEQRMPWITNQSVNAILTTSSDANSEWWGTIISSQTNDNWEPAPWMRDAIDYGTIFSCQNPQRPKILWYWVR